MDGETWTDKTFTFYDILDSGEDTKPRNEVIDSKTSQIPENTESPETNHGETEASKD